MLSLSFYPLACWSGCLGKWYPRFMPDLTSDSWVPSTWSLGDTGIWTSFLVQLKSCLWGVHWLLTAELQSGQLTSNFLSLHVPYNYFTSSFSWAFSVSVEYVVTTGGWYLTSWTGQLWGSVVAESSTLHSQEMWEQHFSFALGASMLVCFLSPCLVLNSKSFLRAG